MQKLIATLTLLCLSAVAAAQNQAALKLVETISLPEVDEGLLAELGRNVSHAHRLDYDTVENRTVVSPGYFEAVGSGERRALQQA